MKMHFWTNGDHRGVTGPDYNYVFNLKDGTFTRWGRTYEEDPPFAPGNEILDLEISTGQCMGACEFCYKANGKTQNAHHMTLEQFKIIFNKMPPTLTQIAFGLTDITANPDFFAMMEYARQHGVVPNYTCHGLDTTPEIAQRTAELCGAVAISVYNKQKSYDAVRMYLDTGVQQVVLHHMLSRETLDRAYEILHDILEDPRLEGLGSIIFLAYKPKGRNAGQFTTIKEVALYQGLIQFCFKHGISYGCDSCSAPMVLKSYEGTKAYEAITHIVEPCEAACFSSYVNAYGEFYPCSFTEGEPGWETGLDVLSCVNFVDDIWHHPRTLEFRSKLLGSTGVCRGCISQKHCRTCPTFDMKGCRPYHGFTV